MNKYTILLKNNNDIIRFTILCIKILHSQLRIRIFRYNPAFNTIIDILQRIPLLGACFTLLVLKIALLHQNYINKCYKGKIVYLHVK